MSTEIRETQPEIEPASIEEGELPSTRADNGGEQTASRGFCSRLNCIDFGGINEAKGYATLGVARGSIIMSNIFLSTALIQLATEESGCEKEEECANLIYGFKPSSLITNIATVSGILTAFFMPIIGAVLDFTNHRRLAGILSAAFITLIQITQIGTLPETWFPMALLQALGGFIYNIQVLATFSYLPHLARHVGEKTITKYTATFTMLQFSAQAMFLIVIIAIALGLSLDDVKQAQISQAVDSAWTIVCFAYAWTLMPNVPALHKLPEGRSLVTAGFAQIWKTGKGINTHYGGGLRWFLIAVVFGASGANAFTVVSVTYMVEVLKMNGTQIGIIFLVTLFSTVPGAKLGAIVSKKTNPITSFKLCLYSFSAFTIAGSLVLDRPERANITYFFGVLWGISLGWFYPTENIIFSLSLPKGQESEMTGFFIYCTQIVVWLPPLIFTIMNEQNVNMKWGLMSLIIFFAISLFFLHLMEPWEKVVAVSRTRSLLILYDDTEEEEEDEKDQIGDEESPKKVADCADTDEDGVEMVPVGLED